FSSAFLQNGIVHRDLKLENILLDGNGDVKIADFGLSNLYCGDEYLQTFCGSPLYASPEIVNGQPYKGPEVDSWSLGVLLYTLVHGSMPFDGLDYRNLVRQITTGEYRKPPKPSEACGLIRWMLMVNPERRATLEEIAGHWWLNWGYQCPLPGESEPTADQSSGTVTQTGGLAGIADWLRRNSRPLLENTSKVRCLLRPQGGGDLVRQRSLRRSRKENNVAQMRQDGTSARPFKGILKKRGSLRQKATGEAQSAEAGAPKPAAGLPSPAPPTASLPRKGILKKPVEQESGYCSSPSPESCDSTPALQPPHCPAAQGPPQPKGILKRNGKFSSCHPQDFGSLDQLASGLHLGSRTRPSGAISEDSILSSESFDMLDLPERAGPLGKTKRSTGGAMRGCRGVGDSAFSLTDCENVTEAYRRAVE
ncbi:NUAK family SNF1-like kinase 2-like, partial [Scleropages formosus]